MDECSPVEAMEIIEIIRVCSQLQGFDITHIFIISSYKTHCTVLRQSLLQFHPALYQKTAVHVIDQCVSTVATAKGLDHWLVIYSPC